MSALRQVIAMCAIGLRSLPQRRSTALVIVVGTACVVGVLVSMLSVTVGTMRASRVGGSPSRAIIYTKGRNGEWGNDISRDAVNTILNAPGIAKSGNGKPLADPEMLMSLLPPEGFVQGTFGLRVFGAAGTMVHPQFRIVSGRMFRAGAQEIVVGTRVARRFGLVVGHKVVMPQGEWPIVGIFSSGGEGLEGQFVADADTVMSAAGINGFGSVTVQLTNAEAYPAFAAWLNGNPTLNVDVERQTDYNQRQAGRETQFFTLMSYGIGVIMALGALFGTARIMFAAVRARTQEIGTLRALGFGGAPIVAWVLAESVALSLTGAAFGAGIAWLLCDGREVPAWGLFSLHVSPQLLALGLAWGAAIALLGGVLPALRAARLPAVEALRAL
jgi:putative ABC transport system permease protein